MNLFVYGTLMGGQPQGALLGRFRRLPAHVKGSLFRMPAGYPAVRLDEGGQVHGELVLGVDARTLSVLDHYEGVDEGLYARVPCDVVVGLRREPAELYVMADPARRGGVPIPSGRWTGVIRR